MKIICKEKDYYDYCGYGIDENLIFNRYINSESELREYMLPFSLPMKSQNMMYNYKFEHGGFYYSLFYIAFCGGFYPVLQVIEDLDYQTKLKNGLIKLWGYNTHTTIENSKKWFVYNINEIKKITLKARGSFYKNQITAFLEMRNIQNTQMFIDLVTPYFIIQPYYNRLNNNTLLIMTGILLRDYDFHNIMNCTTAHQEISMFLPLINNVEDNCINSSDKIKRDNHGFDDKSFKSTKPGDKKTRRQINKKRKNG